MQGLKIGFDAKRLFNNFTGLGNYSRSLVSGLHKYFPENQLFLFTPKVKETKDTAEFLNAPYNLVKPKLMPGGLWRTFTCKSELKKHNIDIFHGLSHELPIGLKKTNTESVVTIHDLIYKTFPNDFSAFDRKIYDYKFRYACHNADAIIAVSESTKHDIQNIYGIPSEKIKVIYQTCHSNFKLPQSESTVNEILSNYGLPNQFMLYVGTVIERKNLLTLVQAYDTIKDQVDLPLVVVGSGNLYYQKVKDFVKEVKLEKKIHFAPKILFHHLPALYQRATIFIYPSVYEGFGIPIIEALWNKTPVITSNCSSLPEAAGPGAFYCNPTDKNSIANGILSILNNTEYAQKLAIDGYNYVQQFNEQLLTHELMDVYQSVLKGK
jgi:glycosyltransferase involved in cell wall biosynthesis